LRAIWEVGSGSGPDLRERHRLHRGEVVAHGVLVHGLAEPSGDLHVEVDEGHRTGLLVPRRALHPDDPTTFYW
jgi:hypothetical protein